MRRVVLAGAPTGCWTNLGDEAILVGMAAALRRAEPDIDLSVVSSNKPGFLDRYRCNAVPFNDIEALDAAVAAADLVVLGGGSIFFDYWDVRVDATMTERHRGVSLWASVSLFAAAHGRPLMVYGAGVGPLRGADAKRLTGAIFEVAAAICVRDRRSLDVAEALTDLDDTPAQVTGDPALSVQLPPAPALELERPWLGVALRQWDIDVDQDAWQTAVASALDRHAEQHGGSVLFVPCHRAVSWPLTDDSGAAIAVRERMTHSDRAHLVDVELPWDERAALLAACDIVLAMRYHAALFALAAGVPVVTIDYDPKVEQLMVEWDRTAYSLALPSITEDLLSSGLERAVAQSAELAIDGRRRAGEQRSSERRNVERALSLICAPTALPRRGSVRELAATLADGNGLPLVASSALERILGRGVGCV